MIKKGDRFIFYSLFGDRGQNDFHQLREKKSVPSQLARFWGNKSVPFFLLILLVLAIDQASKQLALAYLDAEGRQYLGGFLQLKLVYNDGGFLGVVAGLPSQVRYLLLTVGVGLLLFVLVVYVLLRPGQKVSHTVCLALVVGGGLANLLDRFIHPGGVVDFLLLVAGPLRTGIFNLADVAVLGGSCWLGALLFRQME